MTLYSTVSIRENNRHMTVQLHGLLMLAALIGLGLRLRIAWQPVEELAWRVTADDAYYYFRLAQNIISGAGVTFDGIHLTNGFHPLYTLLLVPLLKFAGNDLALGVNLALTLVAILSAATAWPVYRIGQQVDSDMAGLIGAVLHLLNPWMILIPMTGVESAVYLFTFAWAIVAYLVWRNQPTTPHALVAGGAIGLTIMGRSEGGLLLAGVMADVLWQNRRDLARTIRPMAIIALSATTVCLPWAVWSTANFGTPFQVSGPTIIMLSHANRPTSLDSQIVWYLKQTAWFSLRYAYKIILYNVLAVLMMSLAFWAHRRDRERLNVGWQAAAPLAFLGVPFVLITLYYNVVMWHQQHWYFSALMLIATVVAAPIIVGWLGDYAAQYKLLFGIAAGAVGLCAGALFIIWTRGFYSTTGQHERYLAGRWLAKSQVQSAVFAASDNGLFGYYCQCKMVNTEGVVNNSIYNYYQSHGFTPDALGAYLRTEDIQYMILPQSQGEQATLGNTRLMQEQSIGNTGWALYKIQP
jgi:hypothetical protein